MDVVHIAHWGLWIVVVIQGLAICGLFYRNAELAEIAATSGGNASGLPRGSAAPAFSAIDLAGGSVVPSSSFLGRRTCVLFVSVECGDCRKLMAGLGAAPRGAEVPGLVVYCQGSKRGCVSLCGSVAERGIVLAQHEDDIAAMFGLSAFPAIVEMDQAWRIVGYSYPETPEHVIGVAGGLQPNVAADAARLTV